MSHDIFDALNVGLGVAGTLGGGYRSVPQVHITSVSAPKAAAEGRLELLEDRVNKLALINMAMWSLLRQTSNLSEEDLVKRVQEVDLMDGKLDGRISPQVAKCSSCSRVMSPRHTKCMYCGEAKLVATVFDTLG